MSLACDWNKHVSYICLLPCVSTPHVLAVLSLVYEICKVWNRKLECQYAESAFQAFFKKNEQALCIQERHLERALDYPVI